MLKSLSNFDLRLNKRKATNTLQTGPKPPSPSLFLSLKLSVDAAMISKIHIGEFGLTGSSISFPSVSADSERSVVSDDDPSILLLPAVIEENQINRQFCVVSVIITEYPVRNRWILVAKTIQYLYVFHFIHVHHIIQERR